VLGDLPKDPNVKQTVSLGESRHFNNLYPPHSEPLRTFRRQPSTTSTCIIRSEEQIMTAAPAQDFSPDLTLTPQQHRIITLLAAGNSLTQAAAAEDIHRNTIGYWRRTVPAFARELEFAIREQRLYWHEQATSLAPLAIQVIEECLTHPDSSPSLRFRAATFLLKLAIDPQAKAIKPFPTLAPEVEALSGQMLAWRKEMLTAVPPLPQRAETPAFVQPAELSEPEQKCTKVQPIRVAPQPGRNSQCPCGSNLKFKRCCANKRENPAVAAHLQKSA
jgi:hypothetical protein